MQPKVSMVVTCYNKEKYIGDFFESVYNQVWDNIELILVNDGSTDGTRGIISQWESRFQTRRYKLIIIDQENQGVAMASKNGLSRASGEYVCLLDCDDELDSEYVSKMAGFLEGNRDYEWVACRYLNYTDTENGRVYYRTESAVRKHVPEAADYLESFLFGCVGAAHMAVVYMVRMDYLKKCNVVENYYTELRRTQEPQFFIPLAAGGGELAVLPDKLYKYNIYREQRSTRNSYEVIKEYCRQYFLTSKRTIESLSCSAKQKRRLLFIERFRAIQDVFAGGLKYGRREDIMESASALLDYLNENFLPPPNITSECLEAAGVELIYNAVKANILKEKLPQFKKIGRLIACGALGQIGTSFLSRLNKTPLEPDVLWDGRAKPDSELFGHKVVKPDYDSLLPDDMVLIFPVIKRVVNEIKSECLHRDVTIFIDYYDMLDILSAHYFPEFYGRCEFDPPSDRIGESSL